MPFHHDAGMSSAVPLLTALATLAGGRPKCLEPIPSFAIERTSRHVSFNFYSTFILKKEKAFHQKMIFDKGPNIFVGDALPGSELPGPPGY